MVYPLVAIPAWIVSRYFYHWAGKVARYLLAPLLVAYAVYKVVAFLIARATNGQASLLFGSYDNAEIAAVGVELDGLLATLIELLDGEVPAALR